MNRHSNSVVQSAKSEAIDCPGCGAALQVDIVPPAQILLCSRCGHQFRRTGSWPSKRTSGKAVASMLLGIASVAGMCFTGIPAFLLGIWALCEIDDGHAAETLAGRGMATAGVVLGGVFSLALFAAPLLMTIPLAEMEARQNRLSALERRALEHVRDESWEEAAAVYEEVIALDPGVPLHRLRAAPLYVLGEDTEGYRAFCRRMLADFEQPSAADVAEKVSKACLLVPLPELEDEVERMAARATAEPDSWVIAYGYVTHAWSQYRQGNHDAAIRMSRRSLAAGEGIVWYRDADAYLVQAMALSRLGRQQDAEAALRRGRRIIVSRPRSLDADWHDELICGILLKEAETTLGVNQPD